MSTTSIDEARPVLSDEQWARLTAYSVAEDVEAGTVLFRAGDTTYDLIVVQSSAFLLRHFAR
jgi:thioredoxin reductase (NADPH)